MTKRENILSCLRRQGYDSIPVDFDFCPSQVDAFEKRFGHRDYQEFFGLCHRGVWLEMHKEFTDGRTLFTREAIPAGTDVDEWGVGHSRGSAAALHMTRMHHPLKGASDLSEIENFPFPSLPESEQGRLGTAVSQLHDRGLAAVAGMQCTVWEHAWYLRSMEDLMLDMMTGDDKATALLDRVTGVSSEMARTFARADADILSLGDDVGTQTGPLMGVDMWDAWIKPRLSLIISAAREIKPDILVFYHSCGFVTPFIDGLIEIGVNILNPVQPECMPFDEVHASYGDRLSFWGTIGTQTTLPFGTVGEVKAVTRSRLSVCGRKGGIVIGPTHLVEPEVPWDNLLALYETARDFRV